MTITTILVVVSTAVSGGLQEVSVSNKLDYIVENADQILENATENFDIEEFLSLSNEEQEDLTKASLLKFNQEFGLIDDDVAYVLAQDIDSYETIDLPIANDLTHVATYSSLIGANLTKDVITWDISNDDYVYKITPIEEDESLDYLYFDDSRADDSSYTSTKLLPIYEQDEDVEISYDINKSCDDYALIGIEISADTCISFYNIITEFLNNAAMKRSTEISSLAGSIIELILLYYPYGKISTVINSITEYFSLLWDAFISFISGHFWMKIILAIIAIIVACVVYVCVKIYLAGMNKKGYRLGWMRSDGDWDWVNDEF